MSLVQLCFVGLAENVGAARDAADGEGGDVEFLPSGQVVPDDRGDFGVEGHLPSLTAPFPPALRDSDPRRSAWGQVHHALKVQVEVTLVVEVHLERGVPSAGQGAAGGNGPTTPTLFKTTLPERIHASEVCQSSCFVQDTTYIYVVLCHVSGAPLLGTAVLT